MQINDFPTTRYQGSKRKIVLWLHSILEEHNIQFETVLDAFGGSGVVSYLFKKMGKSVTYNDNLRFNYIIGKAIIENSKYLVSNVDVDKILEARSNSKIVTNNFSGIYYYDAENEWIDNVIHGIETVFKHKKGNQYMKAVAYYALFQACMTKRPYNLFHRKNLNLRKADVKRSFGNKVTWDKMFDELFKKFIVEANSLIFDNGVNCYSSNQSVFDIPQSQYDLVYFDPPYFAQNGNHETANYSKCYHFLEGIANYEKWEQYIDYTSTNLRFKDNVIDNDFNEKEIHENIAKLIEKYRDSIIVFSYKRGGKPGIEYIVKKIKAVKENVFTQSIHYKYALNHQNGNAQKNREVLIIGY